MADHEFQESEVIFSDNHALESCLDFRHQHQHQHGNNFRSNNNNHNKSIAKKKKKSNKMGNSVPVNIPNKLFHLGGADEEDGFEEAEWDDGELVPPHLIVRRRIAGKMAFSVCTGNGRTLKGRDLSQVRNSILRLTGFLEA